VSLVGVLVVLVILSALGAMAAFAVSRVPTSPHLSGLTPAEEAGLANKTPGSGPSQPRSPVQAAAPAACMANVRLIEQAATAKFGIDGTFPATVTDLVSGRWLDEAPALKGYDLTMATVDGRPTGKVLVNDLAAEQGCAAPPRKGP